MRYPMPATGSTGRLFRSGAPTTLADPAARWWRAAIHIGLRALAGGAIVLATACGGGETREHRVVGAGFEPLASDFMADSGKVRAILLASPT